MQWVVLLGASGLSRLDMIFLEFGAQLVDSSTGDALLVKLSTIVSTAQ